MSAESSGGVRSSAIITAVFRALMAFYDVKIPREVLPSLILGVETDVSDAEQMDALGAATLEAFGKIDGLVATGGCDTVGHRLHPGLGFVVVDVTVDDDHQFVSTCHTCVFSLRIPS